MGEWRVPVVLFLIVLLLSVILGIKIINNTPEKQRQEIISQYNEKEENDIADQNFGTSGDFEDSMGLIFGGITKEIIKRLLPTILIAGLIIGFFIIVNCRIYSKLGIYGLPVKLWVILSIASFLSIFLFNNLLTTTLSIAMTINNLILIIIQYKIIGVNPYLLLFGLIPGIGIIIVAIVGIYATCKLAEYFGKGTGFQLGLIFLPIVFLPILAFESE